jgi:hypothetical protein
MTTKLPTRTTCYSQLKEIFLISLADDLRRMGMPVDLRRRGHVLHFRATLKNPSPAKLRDLMKVQKARRLDTEAGFLKRVAATQLLGHFPATNNVAINQIKPQIVFCHTRPNSENDFR